MNKVLQRCLGWKVVPDVGQAPVDFKRMIVAVREAGRVWTCLKVSHLSIVMAIWMTSLKVMPGNHENVVREKFLHTLFSNDRYDTWVIQNMSGVRNGLLL
jgi:hypothetical protein